MSKIELNELLFNDQPITINRKLARYLGVNEAIIFQQIHYWLLNNKKENRNFKNNKYWVYNSISQWKEKEFDFLSEPTIKRTLRKLVELGLLEVANFNKMKGDKTNWYTINYNNLIEVCEKLEEQRNKISDKRKAASRLGLKAKKENKKQLKNTPSVQIETMGTPSDQIDPTHRIKLNQPIPKTTNTKTTTSSSSIENDKKILVDEFKKNICELKKTTGIKFLDIIKKHDKDFVLAIIEQCSFSNIKSYAGFEKVYNSYLERGCSNREEIIKATEKFRIEKSKKTIKPKNNKKSNNAGYGTGFNNFKSREYDYDDLEKKLLGWD